MKILSFDVTNQNILISISEDENIIATEERYNILTQSELLVVLIEKTLKDACLDYSDLDLVTFINGPASFTSVRIGYIAAKAIKLCCDKISLFTISNNMAVAADYLDYDCKQIVTILDARLDEVYFQIFKNENRQLKEKTNILLLKISEIERYLPKNDFILAGNGKNLIKEYLLGHKFYIEEKNDVIKLKNIIKSTLLEIKNNKKPLEEPIYIREVKIG
jgi:tRNA threonylcarbamoyl adenosine modification protein YeaZ